MKDLAGRLKQNWLKASAGRHATRAARYRCYLEQEHLELLRWRLLRQAAAISPSASRVASAGGTYSSSPALAVGEGVLSPSLRGLSLCSASSRPAGAAAVWAGRQAATQGGGIITSRCANLQAD